MGPGRFLANLWLSLNGKPHEVLGACRLCIRVCQWRMTKETAMRFLTISGPGVAQDEDFCPTCHVLLDERDGYKVCPLCQHDTRQQARQRRIRLRR
jgi:hypothetical protein